MKTSTTTKLSVAQLQALYVIDTLKGKADFHSLTDNRKHDVKRNTIDSLEDKLGFIKGEVIEYRRLYTITPAGRAAILEALRLALGRVFKSYTINLPEVGEAVSLVACGTKVGVNEVVITLDTISEHESNMHHYLFSIFSAMVADAKKEFAAQEDIRTAAEWQSIADAYKPCTKCGFVGTSRVVTVAGDYIGQTTTAIECHSGKCIISAADKAAAQAAGRAEAREAFALLRKHTERDTEPRIVDTGCIESMNKAAAAEATRCQAEGCTDVATEQYDGAHYCSDCADEAALGAASDEMAAQEYAERAKTPITSTELVQHQAAWARGASWGVWASGDEQLPVDSEDDYTRPEAVTDDVPARNPGECVHGFVHCTKCGKQKSPEKPSSSIVHTTAAPTLAEVASVSKEVPLAVGDDAHQREFDEQQAASERYVARQQGYHVDDAALKCKNPEFCGVKDDGSCHHPTCPLYVVPGAVVQPAPQPKKGDVVRFINRATRLYGQAGTVVGHNLEGCSIVEYMSLGGLVCSAAYWTSDLAIIDREDVELCDHCRHPLGDEAQRFMTPDDSFGYHPACASHHDAKYGVKKPLVDELVDILSTPQGGVPEVRDPSCIDIAIDIKNMALLSSQVPPSTCSSCFTKLVQAQKLIQQACDLLQSITTCSE